MEKKLNRGNSGLFVGSGEVLANVGPASLFLSYVFMSTLIWAVMVSFFVFFCLFVLFFYPLHIAIAWDRRIGQLSS